MLVNLAAAAGTMVPAEFPTDKLQKRNAIHGIDAKLTGGSVQQRSIFDTQCSSTSDPTRSATEDMVKRVKKTNGTRCNRTYNTIRLAKPESQLKQQRPKWDPVPANRCYKPVPTPYTYPKFIISDAPGVLGTTDFGYSGGLACGLIRGMFGE